MAKIFSKNYIIISPVRNEALFIEKTIQSVINQTILPAEYIIVNDGSTDSTPDIIKKYTSEYKWIRSFNKPPGKHRPGAGVIEAFYTGFHEILNNSWDFIVKLDGDLSFEKNYFEYQLGKFHDNPKLGMTSGVTFQPNGKGLVMDKMPEDHVRGAAKMYRYECFSEIGGVEKILGWDTIDELKAQHAGWETRSYKNLVLVHYKPIGVRQTNLFKREIKAGDRHYYLGYHPVFAVLRDFYRMFQKPYFIAGFLNIIGLLRAYTQRKERIDNSLIRLLRKKQVGRMTLKPKLWINNNLLLK